MAQKLKERKTVSAVDKDTVAIRWSDLLDDGETLDTVVVSDQDGLTVTGETINAADIVIFLNGRRTTVPAGEASLFTVTGFTAGTTKNLIGHVTTSAGRIKGFEIELVVA